MTNLGVRTYRPEWVDNDGPVPPSTPPPLARSQPSFRKWKVAAGLTNTALGIILGVAPCTVSEWQAGKYFPTPRHSVKLAEIFGVSSEHLWEVLHEQNKAWKASRSSS